MSSLTKQPTNTDSLVATTPETDEEEVNEDFVFDEIFSELGEFGRYQTIVYSFMCLAILLYGHVTLTYVFTAGDLNYRCMIPDMECKEQSSTDCTEFQPPWLANRIPITSPGGLPAKCQRWRDVEQSPESERRINTTITQLVGCNNAYVYETSEINILREFGLQCTANDWKRTIIGSANNAALFVGLPIMGFLSDRFGRKRIFIGGLFACGMFGILKSLTTVYATFLTLEVLDAFLGSGTFMGAYVLAMELVGPTKRTLSGALINCFYTVGVMLLGVYASLFDDYRIWLRVCYAPALFVIAYLWIIPESTRWLFCMNRREEGARNIAKAARVNGVRLSGGFVAKLRRYCEETPAEHCLAVEKSDRTGHLFESRTLVVRMASCCCCWFVNAFVTYGLTLNSVDLAGNKHLNFILMSGIEIPAYLVTYVAMNRLGRRWSLCGMMLLSGGSCVGTMLSAYQFPFFMLGKFAITASFSILYVYTAEIFPTGMRNGLMSSCSMVGRIGSMLAPQTPLLARYMESLPLILYSVSAIACGLMVLHFPETFNTKLPDTVEDALNVGRAKSAKHHDTETINC